MSHQNYQLLFGTELQIPTDWNKKYPELGFGAFNQLYQLINAITEEFVTIYENDTYIGPFCKDHIEGSIIPISYILDLPEMNKNFGFKFLDCLNYQSKLPLKYFVFNGVLDSYWKNPIKFSENCKKIIFSKTLKNAVSQVVAEKNLIGLECNIAHIRFADPFAKNFFVKNDIISDFHYLEESCIKTIYKTCSQDIPLFLLAHDKSNPYITNLSKDFEVIYIDVSDYEKYLPEIYQNGRDIISLCDIIACYNLNVKNLIYQENKNSTSSYSIFLKNTLNYQNSFNY